MHNLGDGHVQGFTSALSVLVPKPGDTITTESSGYVGWDTNATLYDYPGLESPTVLDAIRRAEENHAPGSRTA